jgi:transcriptional regulator with XRE-family HTH domain
MKKRAPKYNTDTIRKKILDLRLKHGLSKADLADQAKVNYNTIVKIESGENKNPTIKTLISIAQAFNISVEELLN